MNNEKLSKLLEELVRIDTEIHAAPWSEEAMYAGIRHLQKNTEVMDDNLEDDETYDNLPDRYDGRNLAQLRNLLPEIIQTLASVEA